MSLSDFILDVLVAAQTYFLMDKAWCNFLRLWTMKLMDFAFSFCFHRCPHGSLHGRGLASVRCML